MDSINFEIHYGGVNGSNSSNIMSNGCFQDFDTIACVRNGIMTMLVLVTATLCGMKICKLHLNRHPTLHQFIIFYCATLECFVCAVHWLIGLFAQFDFAMQYLKLIQFLVVGHFYWMLATRALRKESLINRVLVPMFTGAFIYFTIISILGCIYMKESWVECFQPYWLALSAAEFAFVQLFMIAGFYITRRLNEISTLDSVRRSQKRDLWSLIICFQISAFVGLVYDLTVRTLADDIVGCSGVFNYMQELYTPIFGIFMIIKFLLPIWVMLFVFHPIEISPDQEEILPPINNDGSFTSVFTPPMDARSRYKALYEPQTDYQAADCDVSNSPVSPATTPVYAQTSRLNTTLGAIHEESTGEVVNDNDRRPILQ